MLQITIVSKTQRVEPKLRDFKIGDQFRERMKIARLERQSSQSLYEFKLLLTILVFSYIKIFHEMHGFDLRHVRTKCGYIPQYFFKMY